MSPCDLHSLLRLYYRFTSSVVLDDLFFIVVSMLDCRFIVDVWC